MNESTEETQPTLQIQDDLQEESAFEIKSISESLSLSQAQLPESELRIQKSKQQKRYYIGVLTFIFLNFVARGLIALFETLATPLFFEVWRDKDGDATTDASFMYFVLGLFGFFVYFVIPWMGKLMREPLLLSVSFLVTALGAFLLISTAHFPLEIIRFLFALALIWSFGSPVSQTIILSAFSKILGQKPQGFLMGTIGSAGSVGRIVLPLIAGGFGENFSFIFSASLSVVGSFLILIYTKWVTGNWFGEDVD